MRARAASSATRRTRTWRGCRSAELDVLVIDRIGKDISGLGMDSNVVGRYYSGPTGRGPSIQRIYLRDLTDETEGNAVGIGMADVVHARAVARMDATKTYMNCITAKTPEGARIAMTADIGSSGPRSRPRVLPPRGPADARRIARIRRHEAP